MHDEIRRFEMEGVVGDEADVSTNKESLIHWMESQLRDEGYAPLLDVGPHYSQWYDAEKEHFTFKLSVYGVFVGEDVAWQTAGVMSGKKILKYTPPIKLKQS